MKSDILLTESEKDSLRRFMRVESPLAAYARTIRNEDGKAAEIEPDLLKGIDVDNLPDDLKAKLEEANTQFKATHKSANDLKVSQEKAEKLARDHQARADRNFEILRKHNLVDATGKPAVEVVDDPKVASLQKSADRIAKQMGVKPEVALQYAQMLELGWEEREQALLQKVGGGLQQTFQTVSSLQSDKLLEGALVQDKEGILQIDEVYNSVKENLDALIQSGTTIVPDTIINLRDMAYGRYIGGLKPEEREKVLSAEKPAMQTFSTRRGGVISAPVMPQNRGKNEPTAANAETAAAVASTMAMMKRGMVEKKGAK